ncbi:MAG: lipoate protein ligase C-terminal domain-containing protein [Euryarchaeota archaeon]|nr:lipoate protein ligase C-terminal domain-containing protein [Euryarchaeota archaeon]
MISSHKAKGGLIKLELTVENARMENIKITGDFFIYPEDALFNLERRLKGKTEDEAIKLAEEFLNNVEAPGIELKDFKTVFKKAFEGNNVV